MPSSKDDVAGSGDEPSWLAIFLRAAIEEARGRGDRLVSPDHFALALARPHGVADALIADLGIDPLVWRDEINTLLGWREGASAERVG